MLPEPPEPVPDVPSSTSEPDPLSQNTPFEWQGIETKPNQFGMFREYPVHPTHNPDDTLSFEDLSYKSKAESNSTSSRMAPIPPSFQSNQGVDYSPFPNFSVFALMNWMWAGPATKSTSEFQRLVDILKSPFFKKEEIEDFNVNCETSRLDNTPAHLNAKDGWTERKVQIHVPDGKPHDSNSEIPKYTIPGLHLRSLVDVIREVLSSPAASSFHFTPFKQFWKKPKSDDPALRIHDELYSSAAFVEEYEKVQRQPTEPGCMLERVVIGLMWWSDSTHLASFGSASLWPLYLFFGNQSKYERCKPRSGSCHHIAYIPKVRFIIILVLLPILILYTYSLSSFLRNFSIGLQSSLVKAPQMMFLPTVDES